MSNENSLLREAEHWTFEDSDDEREEEEDDEEEEDGAQQRLLRQIVAEAIQQEAAEAEHDDGSDSRDLGAQLRTRNVVDDRSAGSEQGSPGHKRRRAGAAPRTPSPTPTTTTMPPQSPPPSEEMLLCDAPELYRFCSLGAALADALTALVTSGRMSEDAAAKAMDQFQDSMAAALRVMVKDVRRRFAQDPRLFESGWKRVHEQRRLREERDSEPGQAGELVGASPATRVTGRVVAVNNFGRQWRLEVAGARVVHPLRAVRIAAPSVLRLWALEELVALTKPTSLERTAQ